MAPLPKRRHSAFRQAQRKRALKINNMTLVACPQCGAIRRSHAMCDACGFYDGKQIVTVKNEKKQDK